MLLLLLWISVNSKADTWLCSGIDAIPRSAIKQAYTGNSILVNGQWLKVYMLPFDHPLTVGLFAIEGISTNQVKRLAYNNSLVDRGFRIVNSPEILAYSMASDKPSIGYAYGEVGSVKSCNFSNN